MSLEDYSDLLNQKDALDSQQDISSLCSDDLDIESKFPLQYSNLLFNLLILLVTRPD